VLSNPVYKNLEQKFNTLTSQYNTLQSEITKRDEALIDGEMKELLRQNKEVQPTAIDDLFYRAKTAGFKKTEKGFLNTDGVTLDAFVDGLKTSAKHLFKVSSSSKFNQENINQSLKNNDRASLFQNLNKIN
jgi:hypothetical protein